MNQEKKDEFDHCDKCNEILVWYEVEIINFLHKIGAYCPNKNCERYKILLAD